MQYKRIKAICGLALLFSCFAACGGGTTAPSTSGSGSASENADSNTNLNLSFSLDMILDASDEAPDLEISLDDAYTLPLFLDSDGSLTAMATDMPTMIYRVCATDSTRTGCDTFSDLTVGLDVDLVIDACGRLIDNDDCATDTTEFSGSIDADGTMEINDLSIRVRAFLITGTASGSTADEEDSGLLTFNRIVIDLTTGSASTGDYAEVGSPVENSEVTLVAAGTIATDSEDLSTTGFIATLTGSFDEDPFDFF